MIRRTNFTIKQNREELFEKESGNKDFRCLSADRDSLIENELPWHWHSAFEIDYIAGCDVTFCFAGESFLAPHGSAVFLNTGKIHSYRPKKAQECKVYAILFEPAFLAGNYDNVLFEKYIAPVIQSEITALLIPKKSEDFQEKVQKMIRLCAEEPEYYELLLRAELEKCWCHIMDFLKEKKIQVYAKGHDNERICKMMDYVHQNYSRKISLSDLASAAAIGTRECSRCFQRAIGRSPMEYLTDYRIQTAALRLSTTNDSVTEISETCGFSTIGYFGKVFKQHTGLTPLQYRAACRTIR